MLNNRDASASVRLPGLRGRWTDARTGAGVGAAGGALAFELEPYGFRVLKQSK